MCAKKKLKICLMTQAIVVLSISIMLQIISCILPNWVQVEIDGRNSSLNNVNKTDHYNDHDRNTTDLNDAESSTDELDNDRNGTLMNVTDQVSIEHCANRSYAIWYIGTCIDGTCSLDLYPERINGSYNIRSYFEPGYNFSWIDDSIPFSRHKEFQMEVTIAIGVTFAAVFFISDHKRRYKRDVTDNVSQKNHVIRHYLEMGLIVLSGTLLWVPTMVYGTVNEKLVTFAAQVIQNSTEYRPVTINRPDALICATISLMLFVLAFTLIFIAFLIKRKENQVNQTEIVSLNNMGLRDDRQSVPIEASLNTEESAPPDYARTGNIFVGHIHFVHPVNAGAQAEDIGNVTEPPPPSYEETMRLYKTRDESNIYTKKATRDS